MNSSVLAVILLALLYLGYRLYGRYLERRVVVPDDQAPVPAIVQRDGVDFEPARPVMLFGHHFTAISGAGPIVGPVLATALFGWGAGLAWILLGSVFIGAVHDYLALVCSTRNRGLSIAQISASVISPRAGVMFSLFVWLAMVLVIAVFSSLAAKTLVAVPQVVWPNLLLCPIAVVVGWAVYRRGVGLLWASLGGAALLAASLVLGYRQPLTLSFAGGAAAQQTVWLVLVLLYCAAAAVLPVWLLLQPRDYFSSAFTFGGLLLGCLALFTAALPIGAENPPPFVGLTSVKGPLWPMLFILVACGACSGFHGLVASGTTVKQLPSERHALPIGYGSMILEAALAAMVTLMAAAGLYWKGEHSIGTFSLVIPAITRAEGADWPSVAFVRAFARVVSAGLPFISFPLAMMFAGMSLNATLLDTLDATTRLARFILNESLGPRLAPLRGRWLATLLTVGAAAALALSGGADVLWPVFGAANQLIAALTLTVISLYLLGVRKPSLYAAGPAAFMLSTTVAALLYQAWSFATGAQPNFLLAALSAALALLGLYVAAEAVPRFFSLWASARRERLAASASRT
jgi:carbon starvation protein